MPATFFIIVYMIITGTVVRGHQIASGSASDSPYPAGSLVLQFPHFKKAGLDLYGFFAATINVDISPLRWSPVKADYTFKQVSWIDIIPPETFSFFSCDLCYRARIYPAWIYYPHPETKPEHHHAPSIIEIISPDIAELNYGSEVSISIDKRKLMLY
jgi:hypothetical protein